MDIEFIIQDTFSQIRPTWKLHSSLEEAGKAFEEAVQKTYKPDEEEDKSIGDHDEEEAESVSDEENDPEHGHENESGVRYPGGDDGEHSDDDGEGELDPLSAAPDALSPHHGDSDSEDSTDAEENIIVNMKEELRDPEAEAEFDRELAKLMQESVDARKFERKPVFDVPLPIKRSGSTLSREPTFESENGENIISRSPIPGSSTMAFSLLTKKGNRQQTKVVELPSNSSLAMAMKNTREAERAEKMKIKELVMSYDRMEDSSDIECEQSAHVWDFRMMLTAA